VGKEVQGNYLRSQFTLTSYTWDQRGIVKEPDGQGRVYEASAMQEAETPQRIENNPPRARNSTTTLKITLTGRET
jgi:hypothetical protein